uniref:LEM domain-containing protein n=1 Tax=Anopheles christyi TaxID=43041 RepID=A0A182JXF9_9DIPT
MGKAREMYLALCLLDAIEDANIQALQLVLDKHTANPNTIFPEKLVAPMHLVIGADDESFALRATSLMLQRGGNANLPAAEQMLTPLHIAANLGRVAIVRILLKAGGNVELVDEEGRTPIQHAIDGDHFEVVQVIQNHIFEEKIDRKRKQLIEQQQRQQEQQTVLSPSMRFKKSVAGFLPTASSTRLHPGNALNALQVLEERKLTPNKIHYNFDATSPYYVNITHRRKDRFKKLFPEEMSTNLENISPTVEHSTADESLGCEIFSANEKEHEKALHNKAQEQHVPNRTNLFELTERNLKDFTRDSEPTGRRTSFIECWREKIAELRERSRISRRLDDIDRILNSFAEHSVVQSFMDEVEETFVTAADGEERLKPIDETVISIKDECPQSPPVEMLEKEVEEEIVNAVQPQLLDIIQISEEYIHTDDEAGVVFREKRMITAPTIPTLQVISEGGDLVPISPKKVPPSIGKRNPSLTSLSTVLTLPPLDYDTDALRAELTTLGEPPGPITNSTKKLYLRKLVKLRRHPERLAHANEAKANAQPSYSVELMATVRKEDMFESILDYQNFEDEMASEFQSSTTKVARNFREGHLKKSFVYLLLDPRISENLPAQHNHLEPHELWKRFLSAVFYVGKGKSSRPYCHLYDAIKLYHQKEDSTENHPVANGGDFTIAAEEIIFQCSEESIVFGNNLRRIASQVGKITNRKQMATDSAKLNRIIDIWCAGKGVVCLHVFHNIMPAEAYTREAAIIDAFGIQNLTNLKRGDYYAKCLSWPMKQRKQLGILLLYKAMLIHLAEGETQLLPTDLI